MAKKRRPPKKTPKKKPVEPAPALPSTRKEKKEAFSAARRLDREIPWLVYRHPHRIPRSMQWDLCDQVRALRAHLEAGWKEVDYARLAAQTEKLDKDADKFLAAVRKSARRAYAESVVAALLVALFIRGFLFEAYRIPSGSMIPTLQVGDYLFVSKFVYGLGIPFTNTRFWDFRDPAPGEVVIFAHPKLGPQNGTILIKRVMAVPGDRIRMERNVFLVNGEPLGSPRVLARAAACQLSPDEICQYARLGDDGPAPVLEARAGCPCTFFRESVGPYTWVTQRPSPDAVCECRDGDGSRQLMNFGDWPSNAVTTTLRPLPHANEFPLKTFMKLWPDDKSVQKYMHYDDHGRLEMEVPEGHVFVMGDNRDNSDDSRFWGVVPMTHIKGKALFIWWAWPDLGGRIFRFVH